MSSFVAVPVKSNTLSTYSISPEQPQNCSYLGKRLESQQLCIWAEPWSVRMVAHCPSPCSIPRLFPKMTLASHLHPLFLSWQVLHPKANHQSWCRKCCVRSHFVSEHGGSFSYFFTIANMAHGGKSRHDLSEVRAGLLHGLHVAALNGIDFIFVCVVGHIHEFGTSWWHVVVSLPHRSSEEIGCMPRGNSRQVDLFSPSAHSLDMWLQAWDSQFHAKTEKDNLVLPIFLVKFAVPPCKTLGARAARVLQGALWPLRQLPALRPSARLINSTTVSMARA